MPSNLQEFFEVVVPYRSTTANRPTPRNRADQAVRIVNIKADATGSWVRPCGSSKVNANLRGTSPSLPRPNYHHSLVSTAAAVVGHGTTEAKGRRS